MNLKWVGDLKNLMNLVDAIDLLPLTILSDDLGGSEIYLV